MCHEEAASVSWPEAPAQHLFAGRCPGAWAGPLPPADAGGFYLARPVFVGFVAGSSPGSRRELLLASRNAQLQRLTPGASTEPSPFGFRLTAGRLRPADAGGFRSRATMSNCPGPSRGAALACIARVAAPRFNSTFVTAASARSGLWANRSRSRAGTGRRRSGPTASTHSEDSVPALCRTARPRSPRRRVTPRQRGPHQG